MKSNFFVKNMTEMQNSLYGCLKTTGRLGFVVVIPVDTFLEVTKYPLQAIQDCMLVIFNVLGSLLLCRNSSFKDALKSLEAGCDHLLHTPVAVAMAAPKAIYQFFAIMYNPRQVQPFHSEKTFQRPSRFNHDDEKLFQHQIRFNPHKQFQPYKDAYI